MTTSKPKLEPLLLPTHLAVIRNANGSRIFRTFVGRVNGKQRDLLNRGELSCAFFVSSVLAMERLVSRVHLTVAGTVADMKRRGWRRIRQPRPGAVLVWEATEGHQHIGFSLGKQRAVSTSSTRRIVQRHHWTFSGRRNITSIWWHRAFDAHR